MIPQRYKLDIAIAIVIADVNDLKSVLQGSAYRFQALPHGSENYTRIPAK